MSDPRRIVFATITAVVILGTAYSMVYNTYLDTSDPLISHLPHPLGHSHYFANKTNILNVYFIKKAWGWTSLLFFLSWFTSPPSARTTGRIIKWTIATSVWAMFTLWFFGPSLFDRVIVASGGACTIRLPSGTLISLPAEFCYTRTAVSPSSHPEFFAQIKDIVPPPSDWKALPRLRRGHDVSGHMFLLTMATLFLTDQLRPSLNVSLWTLTHKFAIFLNFLLIGIWVFATLTTSVYFHSPMEKLTGYLLGVAGFLLTQLIPSTKPTATVNTGSTAAVRPHSD